MPRLDRTGPMGMGPMTGRAAGYCAGFGAPGFDHPMPGRFRGMPRGWGMRGAWIGGGRGRRNRFFACGQSGYGMPPMGASPWDAPVASREQEIDALTQQAEWLKTSLDSINQRLEELAQED